MKISVFTKKIRKMLPLQKCGAVVVAAGNATRMGGIDKVMAPLKGMPMVIRSVLAFQKCDAISEIVVVTREDLLQEVSRLCIGFSKVQAVVVGGKDRPASVWAGLNALSKNVQLVAVHDGARPLVSYQVIDRTLRAAHSYGAAAPAIAVKDTVKVCQGGMVVATPDRSKLYGVQTPQVFDLDLLKGALENAQADGIAITDDCSAVEYMGMPVKLVEGDERNIKITTPIDLKIAEMLLEDEL